jgi:phosphoserine phosphatase
VQTLLYLVRHGATANNLARPYVLQGRLADPGLAPLGVEQAKAAAEALGDIELAAVYCSPLQRARQTAEIIAQTHGLAVQAVPRLTEADVGHWEGLDWDTIMARDPEAYEAFMSDPGAHPYLGGESFDDVHQRCGPALDELLDRHPGQTIAAACHNVVNRTLLAGWLGLSIGKARDLRQANGGINLIRRRDGMTQVVTLNSIFHLRHLARTD